ncbi:E3 ubiquitin-protein ligase SIRP1-like [Hevea brasiliensis]|uniref:E3 ubiquitin-protein ligase SIRP1-like n=1 Tax=Hevea brasiliensis TaxID=3981 RepID=UPI0025DEC0B0|nr:E3 ubiquitin-protein ligase SIRP1-like [Hevea brasiliensis]
MSTLLFGDNEEFESFLAEELQNFVAGKTENAHESSSSTSLFPFLFLMGDGDEALSIVELASGEDAPKEQARGASKEYVEKMEKVMMEGSGLVCSVCLNELSIGSEARQLPCWHVYHANCNVVAV